MIQIIDNLREIFRQPKTVKLRVISTEGFDLSRYRDSLGYFFEEIVALEPNKPQYDDLYKGVVHIGAEEKLTADGSKRTLLTVIFDDKKIALAQIQAKLEALGIKTELK